METESGTGSGAAVEGECRWGGGDCEWRSAGMWVGVWEDVEGDVIVGAIDDGAEGKGGGEEEEAGRGREDTAAPRILIRVRVMSRVRVLGRVGVMGRV